MHFEGILISLQIQFGLNMKKMEPNSKEELCKMAYLLYFAKAKNFLEKVIMKQCFILSTTSFIIEFLVFYFFNQKLDI